MDAKYNADASIADSSRQYLMKKASFDIEVNAKVRFILVEVQVRSYVARYTVHLPFPLSQIGSFRRQFDFPGKHSAMIHSYMYTTVYY